MFCLFLCMALTDSARSASTPSTTTPDAPAPVPIDFQQFFKMPVGPYGLEPSKKLLALEHRQVRISGYVVDEQDPTPGLVLLAPVPVSLAEREDGPADDLPGATLFVHLAAGNTGEWLRKQSGRVEVIGRLDLGGREEPDGRISYVRLYVDETRTAHVVQNGNTQPQFTRENAR